MIDKTDTELVALARNGDKDAFGQLSLRYQVMARRFAMRLVADEGLCVFVRLPRSGSSEQPDGTQPFELFMRRYGAGNEIARRLIKQTRAWDAAGRPSNKGLRIRAYPKGTDGVPSPGEFV